ncbi:hypothetical protein BGZ94_006076 [Podila epigama]|nr:hypothetical protein BGZ94_006076 [Podila epigama]
MSFIPNLTYSIASSVWSGTMGKGKNANGTTTTVAGPSAGAVGPAHTNSHSHRHHHHHHHHHSHSYSSNSNNNNNSSSSGNINSFGPGSAPSINGSFNSPMPNGNRRYSQSRRQSNSTYTFSRSHHHHSSSSSSSSSSTNPLTPPHSPSHYSHGPVPDRKPARKRHSSISSMPRTPPSSPQPNYAPSFDQQHPSSSSSSSANTYNFSRKRAFADNYPGKSQQQPSTTSATTGASNGSAKRESLSSPPSSSSSSSKKGQAQEATKAPTTPEERYQIVDNILETENLYRVLAVSRTATSEEIRRAYIAKSRVCHPDKFPEYPRATEAFQKLSLAYETLSKPSSRFVYDSTGGSAGRSMLGGDETLQSVLSQVFFEFMDGDFEVIRNMINTMNNTAGGVRLGEDAIGVIEEMFLRLRFVLHGCKKYMTLVHDQVQQLSEIHHSMRSLAYLDVLGRFRLTLKLSKVMLTIPMIIQEEMRREMAVAAALEGGDNEDEQKKNAGIVGTVFLNDRVETVLKKVVSAIETGERWV